jgi:hypothetical protein
MLAEALTPADIFGYHVRYVVPLFQRPYVWNRRDQWEPLWADVRMVAERLLGGGSGQHFLGAVVVEQAPTPVGAVTAYHVIDGQQRLTTLQLLLDAARRVCLTDGDPDDARTLRLLVSNETARRRPDEAVKVWPTLADRDAFLSVLGPDAGILATAGEDEEDDPDLDAEDADDAEDAEDGDEAGVSDVDTDRPGGAPVAQAHTYFLDAVRRWAVDDCDTEKDPAVRLHALTRALTDHLRAVVIHLDAGDNAQSVFETLNHRGAPLLAADLVKNLVFRAAQARGLDVVELYQRGWAELDGPYWRAYVRRGRQVVPRIDVFLHYWLMTRLLSEVRTDAVFVEFRDHLTRGGDRVEELLVDLHRDAGTYRAITRPGPGGGAPQRFCYRVLGALDAGALTPFYLWLMRWPAASLPPAQRDRALHAVESWAVRRWLCALPGKDTTGLVLDLLRELAAHGPGRAGELTEEFLARQGAQARVWPSDTAVRDSVRHAPLDARILRPRLRMLLEAIEDQCRGESGVDGPCERDLTVEHVLPLAWRQHWGFGPGGAGIRGEAVARRDALVHTLGNLTLVPYQLNAALANLPWTDAEAVAAGLGPTGKRTALADHSPLALNAELVRAHPDAFDEGAISARTVNLAEVALSVWTRPASVVVPVQAGAGTGAPRDARTAVNSAAAAAAVSPAGPAAADTYPPGRYARLTAFLSEQDSATVACTFEQLEDVLGAPLPPSARTSIPYWSRLKTALGAAIAAGGYRPTTVDLWNERVILARVPARRPAPVRRRPPGRRRATPGL